MTLIEARLDAFCERLAGESRCLLALLRLGYTLAQVDALLGGSARTNTRGRPRCAPRRRGKQAYSVGRDRKRPAL